MTAKAGFVGTLRMTTWCRWPIAVALCMFFSPRDAAAQTKKTDPPCGESLTTNAGIYTTAQAARGKDVYAGFCRSCHTVESHTVQFHATWDNRFMSELYNFVRDRMPKNEPGSLSDQEYADVIAYILRMNKMPAGSRELPADTISLRAIRIAPAKSP